MPPLEHDIRLFEALAKQLTKAGHIVELVQNQQLSTNQVYRPMQHTTLAAQLPNYVLDMQDFSGLTNAFKIYEATKRTKEDSLIHGKNQHIRTVYIAFGTSSTLLGLFALADSHKKHRLIMVEPRLEVKLAEKESLASFLSLARSNLLGKAQYQAANISSILVPSEASDLPDLRSNPTLAAPLTVTMRWAYVFSEAGNQLMRNAYKVVSPTLLIGRSDASPQRAKNREEFCQRLATCSISIIKPESAVSLAFQHTTTILLLKHLSEQEQTSQR